MDKCEHNEAVDSSSALDSAERAGQAGQKCSKCRERKTTDEYYHRGGKPDRICKDCKKAAQKDNYQRKTFAQNVDSVIGTILNKVLDYKILRAKIVNEELGRLIDECAKQLQGKKAAMAS